MKQKILFIVLVSTLVGCGSSRKLDVPNVRKLAIEYNPQVPLNYGKSFDGKVIAHMNNGEQIDVTDNKYLTVSSPNLTNTGTNFQIIGHPDNFSNALIVSTLTVEGKEESFSCQDTITLNFMGPLSLNFNGAHGSSGEDQKDRSKRLIGRNGKDGDPGGNGVNGGNSDNYDVYIWKDGTVTMVRLVRKSDNFIYAYKSVNSNEIVIDLSGGNGGNGGNGGDGSDGKDGEVKGSTTKGPGNGGNGGSGGNAGNGGNAGTANIFIHTNASSIASTLVFRNTAGNAGKPGVAGVPGKAGKPLTGQTAVNNGTAGLNGTPGISGTPGSPPNIQVQTFDYSTFK